MENDQPPFIGEALPVEEPNLTPAWRGWRMVLSLLTVAVVLVGIWATIVHISARQPAQSTVTAQPPQLSGAWTKIALPAPKSQIASVLASPVDPATIFACVGSLPPNTNDGNGGASGQYRLWRTRDSGAHWTTIAAPALNGYGCEITIANDTPQRILLTLKDTPQTPRPCTNIQLYLSDDSGATWQSHRFDAPTPTYASEVYCVVYVTAHHLYSEYSYGINANDTARQQQIIRFARSDDDGATWQAADTDLGASNEFHPYQLGDDNSFVAAVRPAPVDGKAPTLWITHDAGRHWSTLGKSGGDTFIFTPNGDNATPTPALPWYALTGEQVNYVTIFQTTDLQHWTKLPRLSQTAKNPDVAVIITVLSNGDIVVLGNAPPPIATPTPGTVIQQNAPKVLDIWLWNPHTARWSVIDAPIGHVSGCGLCPGHFITNTKSTDGKHTDTYIWIYDDNSPDDVLYRMLLPH